MLFVPMSKSMIERRLVDVSERLKRLRAEHAVTLEQLGFLEEEADEARLRSLVSETPLADADARETRRHADAMATHRASLERSIADLQMEQDRLLDQMANEADPAGTGR
jgi:hypothetical protein